MSIDWDAVSAQLNAKLDISNVQPPKKFGPKGAYIEGWHAIAEANRIFGFGGWSYDVVAMACVSERTRDIGKDPPKPGWGVTYTAQIRVTVEGITREDVGAGHGYDVDCGLAHESATKEAVTDALKRALRTFGNPFGLALYDKSRENVGDIEADKRKGDRFNGQTIEQHARKDPAMQAPSPEDKAIAWIKDAADLDKLHLRWSKLTAESPAVAADPAVQTAYQIRLSDMTMEMDEVPF